MKLKKKPKVRSLKTTDLSDCILSLFWGKVSKINTSWEIFPVSGCVRTAIEITFLVASSQSEAMWTKSFNDVYTHSPFLAKELLLFKPFNVWTPLLYVICTDFLGNPFPVFLNLYWTFYTFWVKTKVLLKYLCPGISSFTGRKYK